jgi:hypothetical protein
MSGSRQAKMDPEIALVEATMHSEGYRDGPSSAMVLACGQLKSCMTGKVAEIGDRGTWNGRIPMGCGWQTTSRA